MDKKFKEIIIASSIIPIVAVSTNFLPVKKPDEGEHIENPNYTSFPFRITTISGVSSTITTTSSSTLTSSSSSTISTSTTVT